MFEITIENDFAAAHRLREYGGNCERLHGHNWHVALTVGASELNTVGLAVDFRTVRQWLSDVLKHFDHNYLNDLEEFADRNPSCERIAKSIFERVSKKIAETAPGSPVRVIKVRVWESPGSSVTYRENLD